jgi:rhodanese-related sulfurtransferase
MKRVLLLAVLVASVGVVQLEGLARQSTAATAPVKELRAAEVEALLAKPDQVLVVDLRIPSDIELQGAFPVFLSVAPSQGDARSGVEKHLSEIPKGRQIIAVATRASDASAAAALLASRGFTVAGVVGATSYEQQGGRLVAFKRYTHWAMTGKAPPNPRAAAEAPKAFKELHKDDVDAMMAAPDRVLIVDVRSPGEIAYWGGFPVILSIQSAEGDTGASGIEQHLAEIPKDKTIVTVSGRANRSGFAAALLEKQGFKVSGAIGVMTYGEEGGKLLWKDPAFKPPVQ